MIRLFMLLFPLCFQAHVVAAFEQSLSNMTHRLQNLSHTAEQKVREFFSNVGPMQKSDLNQCAELHYSDKNIQGVSNLIQVLPIYMVFCILFHHFIPC